MNPSQNFNGIGSSKSRSHADLNRLTISESECIKSNLSDISSLNNFNGRDSRVDLPDPDIMRSNKQICDCRPRILLVDDNEYNMMPLKYFIKELQIDSELLKIVMPNFNELLGFNQIKNQRP